MKEHVFVSAVIYLHNSERIVSDFLLRIDSLLSSKFKSYEIILINDSSKDNTVEVVKRIEEELNGKVILIDLAWKHGSELAMWAGCDIAVGDFIFEIEHPSLNYEIDLIWNLYQKSLEGFDIVNAVPKNSINFTSKLFYKLLKRVSYLKLDLQSVVARVVTRRALNSVLSSKEKVRYRKALYKYTGLKDAEIIFKFKKNEKVNSRSIFENFDLAFNIFIYFSDIGYKLTLMFSLFFLFFSAFTGIYSIIIFFTKNSVPEGWTTLILFSSFGFSGVFFVTALISKYLSLILVEIQGRRPYVAKSVEMLTNNR